MNYLLTAQTLLDLVNPVAPSSAANWAAQTRRSALRVSVISVAAAAALIDELSDAPARRAFAARVEEFVNQMRADGPEPLSFTQDHARFWETLIHHQSCQGVPQSDRMVLATAMHEGLVLVDREGPLLAAARSVGAGVHAI